MHQNVSLPSSHLSSADISLCGWAGILSPSSSSLHNWFSMGLFGSSSPFCKGVYSFPPLLFQPRIEEEVCVGDTVPHNVNATSGLSHGNQAPESSLVCAKMRDVASFFPSPFLGDHIWSDEPWLPHASWVPDPSSGLISPSPPSPTLLRHLLFLTPH